MDSAQAYTTYGVIGIKCWVYKGEILPGAKRTRVAQRAGAAAARPAGTRRTVRNAAAIGPWTASARLRRRRYGAIWRERAACRRRPILPPMQPPTQQAWKQEAPESAPETAAPETGSTPETSTE